MTDKVKQARAYVKNWYVDGFVVTIMMDASDEDGMNDYCIQSMVVEMLKDFINNPIPTMLKEGSMELDLWVETTFKKVMQDLDFGFTEEQVAAVKNLAFNYWVDGIDRVRNDPANKGRRYKCVRRQGTKH